MTKLPFKSEERPSVNLRNAYAQLTALQQKFEKNTKLLEDYSKIIQDYIDRDFIEEVIHDKFEGSYFPHHPVYKESSNTTAVRIVFNDSSKPKNGSP